MKTNALLFLVLLLLPGCGAPGGSSRFPDYETRRANHPKIDNSQTARLLELGVRTDGLVEVATIFLSRAKKYDPTFFRGYIYKGSRFSRFFSYHYDRGRYVLLDLGDFWEVRPEDYEMVSHWGLRDSVRVEDSPETKYPYAIYNKDRDQYAIARFMGMR